MYDSGNFIPWVDSPVLEEGRGDWKLGRESARLEVHRGAAVIDSIASHLRRGSGSCCYLLQSEKIQNI